MGEPVTEYWRVAETKHIHGNAKVPSSRFNVRSSSPP